MLSATPRTPAVDPFHDRQLSVLIPDDNNEEREEQDRLLGQSLSQSWERARARFKKETGEDLGDYRSTKRGILGTLKQQYGSDSKEAKKRDDIYGVVELVLNGVELVAATAALGASIVFGPAQMCFNALDILISIPRAIKKYAEDLESLFKEVSSYLNKFRIYDRIDRRGNLDAALLTSNNDILITLVEMCMLAFKVLKNPIKTVLSNIFLKNDAINVALGDFRDLVDKQNQLTSTMTLETVLKNETLSRQILQRSGRIEQQTTETNVLVRGLAAESVENKNLKVDRDRILKIDRNLDLNEAAVNAPLDGLKAARPTLLDDTITLLETNADFKEWRESIDRRKLIYIAGKTGSGKTNLLSAIAQQIEDEKKKLHAQQMDESKTTKNKDDRSIYLTYYKFSLANKVKDRGKFDTPVHTALKVMAAQLARQSTRYASTLNEVVESVQKGQKTLQDLWKALKLSDFRAPENSILYMFFDGLDQLKSSLQELGKTMKLPASRKAPKNKDEMLRFKIILTGKSGTGKKLPIEKLSVIHLSEINSPLIRTYVEQRLQILNIFQDDDEDSKERKEKVLQIIPETSSGSFGIAAQKIKMIEEAVEEDADFEALVSNLQQATLNTLADDGRKILERMSQSSDLSTQHKEQLRELLIWTVYGKRRPDLDELEAALYLQHDKKSLEPLKRKIENRFEEALEIIDATAYPRDPIEEALNLSLNLVDTTRPAMLEESAPRITINVSVEGADEPAMRQFVSDLSSKISDAKLNFTSQYEGSTDPNKLIFSQGDAESTIVIRLLRALNDDRLRRQTTALVKYATLHLPAHLDAFVTSSLDSASVDDLKSIGTALINFLCDSDSIASAWDVHSFDPSEWLNYGNVRSIEIILTRDRLLDNLDPIQRRWANKNTRKSLGTAAFMNVLASTAATKWLSDRSQMVEAGACFAFIDSFLTLLTRGSAFSQEINETDVFHTQLSLTDPAEGRAEDLELGDTPEAASSSDQAMAKTSDSALDSTTNIDTSGDGHAETQSDGENEQVSALHEDKLLLGNFSASSVDITLVGTSSVLRARCYNMDGQLKTSLIDLNDCLTNEWGHLKWKLDGNAFASADNAHLSADCKVLRLRLGDGQGGQRWQNIRLDEQISNENGTLTFLDSANDNSDDHDDTASDTEVALTYPARVKRAEDWAIKTLKMDLDSFALIRIGNTLLNNDVDLAIEYFNKAEPDSQDPWKAVGLSAAYASKEDFKQAVESIQHALVIFRAQHKEAGQTESASMEKSENETTDEVKDLFTCLSRVATYHMQLGDDAAAIECLEEALVCRPSASSCRWQLLGLLCEQDRHSRAEELFDAWETGFKELKAESLTAFVQKKAESDTFYAEVYPVISSSRGTKLYDKIDKVFEDAIDDAEKQERETDIAMLLHNRGIILASGGGEERLEAACQAWIDAHQVGKDLEYPDVTIMYWSPKLAAMCYFDQAMEQLNSLPDVAGPTAMAVVEKLRDKIMKLMSPYHQDFREYDKPTIYISALAHLSNQLEYSRSFLKADMTTAIEILTDEDIFNDATGIQLLFQTLLRSGDTEGALSAWSLYDRVEIRPRLQQKLRDKIAEEENAAKNSGGEDATTNGHGVDSKDETKGINEPACETSINVEESSVQPDQPDGQPLEEVEADNYLTVWCDFCNTRLSSWEEGLEEWWCRYCPEVTFCTPCKEKLQSNQRLRYVCGPKHDLVLVKHPEYTEEEITGSNVRIGWKWEDVQVPSGEAGENGEAKMITKRERVGGRIVELKEWVEILKKEWNVTATQTEGKVQL